MIKALNALCFFLFLVGVLLFLAQMWFQILPSDLFVKSGITIGALLVITFVLNFMIKEGKQTDKINHGKELE
jgi:hypothetical protein